MFQPFFSHIYIESQVRSHPRTQQILEKFPSAQIIEINHYKDVFCRSRQNPALQRRSRNLILAAKSTDGGHLVYPGAPVCQSFGHKNFYYTSCIMNCVYDCAYCYLKGMYPSANIVIFVNLEDLFAGVQKLLEKDPLYLCVSYDTDLAALEQVAGYVREWENFAGKYADRLTVEIRTKCADQKLFSAKKQNNAIYAFTLSPQAVIDAFEHHTPSLTARISCAAYAVRAGFRVRLCFDPLIYIRGWEEHYRSMLNEVFASIDPDRLTDVSVGTFRIAKDYLKQMRRQEPESAVAWFPYVLEQGVYHYPDELLARMEGCFCEWLTNWVLKEKIFLWQEGVHS